MQLEPQSVESRIEEALVSKYDTPSGVMYGLLKKHASLKANELAKILFSDKFAYGGGSIVERVNEKTFLYRVAHAEPGTFPEGAFVEFPQSAQKIAARILAKQSGQEGKMQVITLFSGEICDEMCKSLCAHGLNDIIYRNMTLRLAEMEIRNTTEKLALLVLQLIATGCLGDPVKASEITQGYARQVLSSTFKTSMPSEGQDVFNGGFNLGASMHIGLCRIVNGKIRMPAYAISSDENGTEIGSLATAPGSINDVEMLVSKRHLLVYGDGNGNWFALGLKSTNGSTVIRGDTKVEEVIEPPSEQREEDYKPEPVRIFPSDTLCLAGTTRFMVIELAE